MISLAPLANLPSLESERLILRRLCMRDAPDIYDYSRDPEVARHVLWTAHTSPSESRSYIRYMLRRYRLGEPSSWGIVLRRENRVIGTIGFMDPGGERLRRSRLFPWPRLLESGHYDRGAAADFGLWFQIPQA